MFRGLSLAALAAVSLALAGCGSQQRADTPRCPSVVNYSDAQLTGIQASINKLSKDDILRTAMSDYEQLRDDARYCANLEKEQQHKGLF
ncbi:MAG TPA: hypothetical protein VN632_11825 [Stellaceae bacterium]|nr:hypothetical protein [Stellaceae bacterium]